MRRMQVQLTEEQFTALQMQSRDSGKPMAALVREALEAFLERAERSRRIERLVAAVGGFHSGVGDIAENHDRYLNEGDRW